jgi:hypothetical protein
MADHFTIDRIGNEGRETIGVRSTCAEFLRTAPEFYKIPNCGVRVLAADRCESAKTGRANFSETTPPKTC